MKGATTRVSHLVCITFILGFTCVYFGPYFDLSKDIIRKSPRAGEHSTDLTPGFGVHAETWKIFATEYAELPHWNPYTMGGTPFLAELGTSLISLENVLLIFTRGQVAARLSIPLHLAVGWIGLYLFALAIGWHGSYALVAGIVYLFNPSYIGYHAMTGHLTMIHGVAIAPWLLYIAVRPFSSEATRYILIGLVLALIVHAGSPGIFLYVCALGLPAVGVYRIALEPSRWKTVAAGILLAVAVLLGTTLIRILPALEFMAISDRQYGMSAEKGFFLEFPMRLWGAWAYLVLPCALLAVGSWSLLRRAPLVFAIGSLSVLFAFVITFNLAAYRSLIEYVPFFGLQRIPQRSLFIAYLVVGLVLAYGVHRCAGLLSRRTALIGVGLLVSLLGFVALAFRPHFSTMVDPTPLLERNAVLNHVARDPSFFRITSYQDRDRHWTYEHQTFPLGLNHLLGYARLWHADYLQSPYADSLGVEQYAYIPNIFWNFAGMTGLMAVKYVLSTREVEEEGLDLVGVFPALEGPQPPKSRGPYLYRNERSRPRVYRSARTAGLVGSREWLRAVSLALLVADARAPFVFIDSDAPDAAAAMARVDHVLAESDAAVPAAQRRKLIAFDGLVELPVSGYPEVVLREHSPQRLSAAVGDDAGEWLFFSEKFALFPGWQARWISGDGERRLPIVRANHINSAVWIPDGEAGELLLTYTSPYFGLGSILLLGTLAGIAGFWIRAAGAPSARDPRKPTRGAASGQQAMDLGGAPAP